MPDDGPADASDVTASDLNERIQLCWSPTAQLPLEYGPEARLDLFEQLLSDQIRQVRRRGRPLPRGQHFARVINDDPPLGRGDGAQRFLLEISSDRCRILTSWGAQPAEDFVVAHQIASEPAH